MGLHALVGEMRGLNEVGARVFITDHLAHLAEAEDRLSRFSIGKPAHE